MDYNEIVIKWSKLYPVNKLEGISNLDINTDNVLYQIYGDSHIYGRNVLLYIGISTNAENRLKAHINGVFGYVNNLKVSIGTTNFNGKLEVPESILIANHKPSFNKNFIHDISEEAKNIGKVIIINNGTNLMLKTCCTNYWWIETIH